MDFDLTRRAFLTQAGASLGVMSLGSLTPELLAQAHAHAKKVAEASSGTFRFFTPLQATEFEAFASQIIPTDDTPGAKEANVVHFTDYLLSVFEPEQQSAVKDALKALNDQAAKTVRGATSFASLTSEQQIAAMKAMEQTSGFGLLRGYVVTGMFCDPALGGNKDQVGWKLLGFESTFLYQPPFGYYDARAEEEEKA